MSSSVRVSGALTRDTVVDQINRVQQAIAGGARIIDLSEVTSVDSTSLSLWLEIRRSFPNQSDLEWTNYPEQMLSIAGLVGLDLKH